MGIRGEMVRVRWEVTMMMVAGAWWQEMKQKSEIYIYIYRGEKKRGGKENWNGFFFFSLKYHNLTLNLTTVPAFFSNII